MIVLKPGDTVQDASAEDTDRAKRSDDLWWIFRAITFVSSTLAFVALIRRAWVKQSFTAPLELIYSAYSTATLKLFGWAEPYLQIVLNYIAGFLSWKITLYPHWRDVFVVTCFWVAAFTRTFWRRRDFSRALLMLINGTCGGFAGAIVVGTLPLPSSSLAVQMCIASLPFGLVSMGMFLMDLMTYNEQPGMSATLAPRFGDVIGIIVFSFLTGALALWLVTSVPVFAPYFGLAALMLVVFCIGLLFLWRGSLDTDDVDDSLSSKEVGLSIVGGFVGTGFFFAVDAGLKLLLD
jgi:hypothetical protein